MNHNRLLTDRTTRRLANGGAALALLSLVACGPENSGRASANSSTEPIITGSATALPAQRSIPEVQQFEADVFRGYLSNGTEKIGHNEVGKTVSIACIEYDPSYSRDVDPKSTTRGLWYKTDEGTFVAANTFWNQPEAQQPDQGNVYDPQLAGQICHDSISKQLPPVHPN